MFYQSTYPQTTYNPYFSPQNPYNVVFTQEDSYSLARAYEQKRINSFFNLFEADRRAQIEIYCESVKEKIREQLLEAREKKLLLRELRVNDLVIDGQGKLRRSITVPGQKTMLSEPVMNMTNPSFKRFFSITINEFVYEISSAGMEKPIFLSDNQLDEKNLVKKLVRSGVAIYVSSSARTGVLNQLLSLLVMKAHDEELPLTTGWNFTTKGFVYVKDGEKNFCSVRKEALER